MKLNQLRFIVEVARHDLNISQTAIKLHTSQPGISKQIRLLEQELGVQIFHREGKQLSAVTEAGQVILAMAEEALGQVENIRRAALEFQDQQRGQLTIATTHTQSRYVLPPVISAFLRRYPEVNLRMRQGTPEQMADAAVSGEVDFAIATEALESRDELLTIPCFRWNRMVLVPEGHELAKAGEPLTLEAIAAYPIVTYVSGFTGRSKLDEAFVQRGLHPRVVFTAADADVIKTYVRLGLGIGIIASMALEEGRDGDLVALEAGHLFEESVTSVAFRRGHYLRGFMQDFLCLLAPHLNRALLRRIQACESRMALRGLVAGLAVELR